MTLRSSPQQSALTLLLLFSIPFVKYPGTNGKKNKKRGRGTEKRSQEMDVTRRGRSPAGSHVPWPFSILSL